MLRPSCPLRRPAAAAAAILPLLVATAIAQPPAGPPPDGPPPHGPADRLRAALDANGDHQLDEQELENASQALRGLDEDGNGRIDRHEFRPPMPPPPGRGRGEGERPFRRPDGPPPPEGFRPGRGERRPGEGPSPQRFVERAMAFDADGDGKLDRSELEKFADEMMAWRTRGGPGDRPRGEGPRWRQPPTSAAEADRPE